MIKRDQDGKTNPEIAAGKKRSYKTPQLTVYGTLAKLTASGSGTCLDGNQAKRQGNCP
jgi:hypothetical protein